MTELFEENGKPFFAVCIGIDSRIEDTEVRHPHHWQANSKQPKTTLLDFESCKTSDQIA
jgi:hypothetical protein